MHQPDIAVQDAGHRLVRRLGIAVGDGDRVVLVHAQQHAGGVVAEVVDEAVVQAAVAGAGIEADIGDAEAPQHLGGDVAAPGDGLVGGSFDPVQVHGFLSRSVRSGRLITRPTAVGNKQPVKAAPAPFPSSRLLLYIRRSAQAAGSGRSPVRDAEIKSAEARNQESITFLRFDRVDRNAA